MSTVPFLLAKPQTVASLLAGIGSETVRFKSEGTYILNEDIHSEGAATRKPASHKCQNRCHKEESGSMREGELVKLLFAVSKAAAGSYGRANGQTAKWDLALVTDPAGLVAFGVDQLHDLDMSVALKLGQY